MAANYLHGVETVTVEKGPRPIREVKSAVIFLVGTAPGGPINVPTLCLSEKDDAQFQPAEGAESLGFTIPQALRAIRMRGVGTVVVVNVFDHAADPAPVVGAADIIGTTSAGGVRSGLKLTGDCYNLFGFMPKLLLAPGFSSLSAVSSEMIARAENLGAKAIIDAPAGTSYAQAIAGRGPSGAINFNTSSDCAILCFPHVKAFDLAANDTILQPLSQFAAAAIAGKDIDKSYSWSPSNTELVGVTGLEINLTARIDDPQSEVNLLNEVGIVTVFNSFGTGFRLWGNRLANWPAETGLKTFISCSRTKDMIDEAIRYFSLQYTDRPITQGLIDAIVMSVNLFFNKKSGDGDLLGGTCWFDPKRNVQTELANGHILFSYKFTPPPPAERITYESEMTSEYLVSLKGN